MVLGSGAPFRIDLASADNWSHLSCLSFFRASELFCDSVYSCEQSSKSWGLTSMKSFIALYTMPWIVLRTVSRLRGNVALVKLTCSNVLSSSRKGVQT